MYHIKEFRVFVLGKKMCYVEKGRHVCTEKKTNKDDLHLEMYKLDKCKANVIMNNNYNIDVYS